MIRVVVVAAALASRAGLKVLLEADEQVEILGDAATLLDASRYAPSADVFVVLAGGSAPLAWEALDLAHAPLPGVLLLADDPEQARPLASMGLSGWGLLPTNCTEDELLTTLYAVDLGLVTGAAELLNPLVNSPKISNGGNDLLVTLTDREREVLVLLSEGLANKQISQHLEISEHTVKFHISSIYTKLGVSNRAEAVRQGIQLGLIML